MSETEVKEAEVVAAAPESAVVPEVAEIPAKAGNFIGAEIHIISDARTGAVSVNAPPNMIVAFGLIEVAKSILIEDRNAKIAKAMAQPKIIPAGAGDIAALMRKPS